MISNYITIIFYTIIIIISNCTFHAYTIVIKKTTTTTYTLVSNNDKSKKLLLTDEKAHYLYHEHVFLKNLEILVESKYAVKMSLKQKVYKWCYKKMFIELTKENIIMLFNHIMNRDIIIMDHK